MTQKVILYDSYELDLGPIKSNIFIIGLVSEGLCPPEDLIRSSSLRLLGRELSRWELCQGKVSLK